MTDYNFIEVDSNLIIRNTIAKFEELTGQTLEPADAERILIDVIAYRELAFRVDVNNTMKKNFVQTAIGEDLDRLSNIFAITRIEGESDADLRSRVLTRNRVFSGTKEYYKYVLGNLDIISDVVIRSKNDDSSILYGYVEITPLVKGSLGNEVAGTTHSASDEQTIINYLTSDEIEILGVEFIVASAVPVLLSGSIDIELYIGANTESTYTNIESRIDYYFASLSLSYDAQFSETDLQTEIMQVEGVKGVTDININAPILLEKEFYQKGLITVNYS